jgi:hypothetical protein
MMQPLRRVPYNYIKNFSHHKEIVMKKFFMIALFISTFVHAMETTRLINPLFNDLQTQLIKYINNRDATNVDKFVTEFNKLDKTTKKTIQARLQFPAIKGYLTLAEQDKCVTTDFRKHVSRSLFFSLIIVAVNSGWSGVPCTLYDALAPYGALAVVAITTLPGLWTKTPTEKISASMKQLETLTKEIDDEMV